MFLSRLVYTYATNEIFEECSLQEPISYFLLT